MHYVQCSTAPSPAGHYSQAVVHHGLVYVAGQLAVHPDRRPAPPGTIEEQTELAMRNVAAILAAAGSGLDRVLQVTIYLSDIGLWSRVNAAYAAIMGDHRPARAIVPTGEFRNGLQIEVQVIAAVREAEV